MFRNVRVETNKHSMTLFFITEDLDFGNHEFAGFKKFTSGYFDLFAKSDELVFDCLEIIFFRAFSGSD